MRRLQLLKPWRLRAIRQRLQDEDNNPQGIITIIPVAAPTAENETVIKRGDIDGRSEHRKQAPVADVIFASGTIRDIR